MTLIHIADMSLDEFIAQKHELTAEEWKGLVVVCDFGDEPEDRSVHFYQRIEFRDAA